jgi:hypothetical protein
VAVETVNTRFVLGRTVALRGFAGYAVEAIRPHSELE